MPRHEKTARQIRQLHRTERRNPAAPETRGKIAGVGAYTLPAWLVLGAKVHYCSVIGEEPTKRDCAVLVTPWKYSGTWVTVIDKHRGWVACAALVEAE